MKLFVTGGSGYLGRAILKRAPAAWEVTATYLTKPLSAATVILSELASQSEAQNPHRGDESATRATAIRVTALQLDLRDKIAVKRAIEQLCPDAVIHTAALMSGAEMGETNAQGSQHVADAVRSVGARLVHLSSDVIFDGEHAPYDESATPAPITSYAKSKALAEYAVRDTCPDDVIVRTSLIYGFAPIDPRTSQVLNGEMPRLFTDEFRCPIFVEDLADALLELANPVCHGVLNIAGPQWLSRYEFGLKLTTALQVQPRFAPAISVPVSLSPRSAREMRPRDCTLTIERARHLLQTPLRSVDEVLSTLYPQSAG